MSEQDLSCKEVVEIVNDYLEGAMCLRVIASGSTRICRNARDDPAHRHAQRGAGSGGATRTPARGVPRLEDRLILSFLPIPTTFVAVRRLHSASNVLSRSSPIPGAALGSA